MHVGTYLPGHFLETLWADLLQYLGLRHKVEEECKESNSEELQNVYSLHKLNHEKWDYVWYIACTREMTNATICLEEQKGRDHMLDKCIDEKITDWAQLQDMFSSKCLWTHRFPSKWEISWLSE